MQRLRVFLALCGMGVCLAVIASIGQIDGTAQAQVSNPPNKLAPLPSLSSPCPLNYAAWNADAGTFVACDGGTWGTVAGGSGGAGWDAGFGNINVAQNAWVDGGLGVNTVPTGFVTSSSGTFSSQISSKAPATYSASTSLTISTYAFGANTSYNMNPASPGTVALPDCSVAANTGIEYTIKNVSTQTVTVGTAGGGQTIDNQSTIALTVQYQSITAKCGSCLAANDANWCLI